MTATAGPYREVWRFDWSALAPSTGLWAGLFISAPLLLGILTGQSGFIYSTLGALFLTNVDGPHAGLTRMRIILAASFTEAVAFGLGTLAGTTGLLAVVLMAVGVFLALSLGVRQEWALVGVSTAISFVVGVGLPGGTVSDAAVRLVFMLLGGFWALLGIVIERTAHPRGLKGVGVAASATSRGRWAWLRSEVSVRSRVTSIACALGLVIGLFLGLPRDFWIALTIILAVRPTIGSTETTTAMIVIGTVIGAVVAGVITLWVSDAYVLWGLLLVFAVALNVTKGVNFGLTQAFLTPFIIILLNIIYPGQPYLAEVRILDVGIGGAMAVADSFLLSVQWRRRHSFSTARSVLVGPNEIRGLEEY